MKLAGVIEKEDDEYIESLLDTDPELRKVWNSLQHDPDVAYFRGAKDDVKRRLHQRLAKNRRRRILAKGAMVLSIILLGGLTLILYIPTKKAEKQLSSSARDEPLVSLHLGEGKEISFKKGDRKEEVYRGVSLTTKEDTLYFTGSSENEGSEWNTLEVPKGRYFTLILEDHSVIELGPESRLQFPRTFEGSKKRKVLLEGMANFAVVANPSHPFSVITVHADITVLGTQFEVRSFPDTFETKLASGKLKVKIGQEELILYPGHKVNLDVPNSKLMISRPSVSTGDTMSIELQLVNVNLGDIAQGIGNIYHVTVVVAPESKMRKYDTSIEVYRQKPIQRFLKEMKAGDTYFDYSWRNDTLFLK